MHSIRAQTCCRLIYMVTATVTLIGPSRRCSHSNALCTLSDLLDLWLAQTQSPCPTWTDFQNKGKPVHLVKIWEAQRECIPYSQQKEQGCWSTTLPKVIVCKTHKKVLQPIFEHCRVHEREHSVQQWTIREVLFKKALWRFQWTVLSPVISITGRDKVFHIEILSSSYRFQFKEREIMCTCEHASGSTQTRTRIFTCLVIPLS